MLNIILFVALAMVVCFVFWFLSHAPSKKNKTIKRAKIRKWSTIFFIVTMVILLLCMSQPLVACSIALSLTVFHMAFSRIIESL